MIELTKDLLILLNEEFVNDRKNFFRESSRAGKNLFNQKFLELKNFLKESEEKLE